jgi:signal transduction histidine kinase
MPSRSLIRRLLPPLAGAVAVLTLTVLVVGMIAMRGAVLDRARARATLLLSSERESLERLMRAGDHGDLQNLVEQMARNPDVAAVRIINPRGTVDSSSIPSELGKPAGSHSVQASPRGDLIPASVSTPPTDSALAVHVVQPFLNKPSCARCHKTPGDILGYLDLDASVNTHMTGLMAFSTLSGVLGLLYLAAVIGVGLPLLNQVVRRPVRHLTSAMKDVQAGDLSVHVEPSGTQEIDEVVEGFNRMVEQLRHGRAAEETARRLEMERVEQLAAVGEIAAGLAHEVRNPLSGVKAVLEILVRDTADEERRGVLRDATGELMRIDQILRDLMQYARPKAPVLGPFDLGALVRDTTVFTQRGAGRTAAAVTCDIGPDLPRAFGDPAQVRQVLVNLLMNAHQAAGAAGQIHVSTGQREGSVWCRVRDTGPGVPLDRAETVFRPFATTKARGTGLGLSISKRIIELHGGSLTLDNPGQAGASFTFTLAVAVSLPDTRPRLDATPTVV